MPDPDTLQRLIETYGYAAVLLGTFVEGEAVLLLAGVVVHLGLMNFFGVVAAAWAGVLAGDLVYFFAGRFYGPRWLARSAERRERARRADALIRRHQTRLIVGFRFLFGLRIVIPFAFGTGSIPTGRFVALNAVGALIWAVAGATLGYLFGAAVEKTLHRFGNAEWIAAGALVATLLTVRIALALRTRIRRARATRTGNRAG